MRDGKRIAVSFDWSKEVKQRKIKKDLQRISTRSDNYKLPLPNAATAQFR